MSSKETDFWFEGIDGKMSPGEFIRRFMREMKGGTEEDRLENFEYYLKEGSEADEWFRGLVADKKKKWADLKAEFDTRFPGVKKAKASPVEIERELIDMRLPDDDVGVKNPETEAYKHVEFANRLMAKARAAGIENGKSSILAVRDKLPRILKEKVKEAQADWKAFTDEIAGVDMEWIRNEREKEKEVKKREEKLKEELLRGLQQTPTRGLAAAMSNAQLSSPSTGRPANSRYGRPTMAHQIPTNPFAQGPTQTRPQPSSDELATVRQHMQKSAPPLTKENVSEYVAQCAAWEAKHGPTAIVTFNTPYPLTPGSAPPGSGECFRCGQAVYHRPCPIPKDRWIPYKESEWRRLCDLAAKTSKRTAPGGTAPHGVNFVSHLAWTGIFEDEQGKEEGPSN